MGIETVIVFKTMLQDRKFNLQIFYCRLRYSLYGRDKNLRRKRRRKEIPFNSKKDWYVGQSMDLWVDF